MKHERIITAADSLAVRVCGLESLVSDVKNGENRPTNESMLEERKYITMCEFLNGDGVAMIESLSDRVSKATGELKEMLTDSMEKAKMN